MRFAAVHRSFLVRGPGSEATAAALGTWLRLQSYASSDEVEDPVIRGAASWTDRKWISVANVERAEVDLVVAAGLAHWRGDHLEIIGFDADGLQLIEARRMGGKSGGRGRLNSSAINSPIAQLLAQPKLIDSSPKPLSSPLLSSPLQKRRSRSEPQYTDAFDAFWSRYPNLSGRKTKKAHVFEAWRPVEQHAAEIMAALSWQVGCHDWTKDGGKYEPGPAPYLNQRRWEDARPGASVPPATSVAGLVAAAGRAR